MTKGDELRWLRLTPEEDAIGEEDEAEEEDIDPDLPADLWFRGPAATSLPPKRGESIHG